MECSTKRKSISKPTKLPAVAEINYKFENELGEATVEQCIRIPLNIAETLLNSMRNTPTCR